jgi:hypothetical protein
MYPSGFGVHPGYPAYPSVHLAGYPQKVGYAPTVSQAPGQCSMAQFGRKKFHGAELESAREEIQMGMFQDTFWLGYAWCCGLGCLGPFREGCCVCIGQLCCCAGSCRDAVCWDNDGCLASTIKICCCVWHSEVPPSMTPGIGCGRPFGGCFCCRKMPPPNILEAPGCALEPNEREEFEILASTCWCPFLYCCGIGCNPPGGREPCCKVEGKLCCLWSNCETDDTYEEGVSHTQKCCCLVWDASCPAGRTPGCGCCNCLCGGNLHEYDGRPMVPTEMGRWG